MKSVSIKDCITGETIHKGYAFDRKAAVAIVKRELTPYMVQGDRIGWRYLNENDPNEKGLPKIAEIICADGECVDFIALISDRN